MISKNKLKFIQSLSRKKIRDQHQVFIAEGQKMVDDLLNSDLVPTLIIATSQWLSEHSVKTNQAEIVETTLSEIKKISLLKSPPEVLVVFKQPEWSFQLKELQNELTLFLDEIQDPGNLGTIIRLSDWFGIKHLICSVGCADVFNPKTIQSTMGAISRVKVSYVDTVEFLKDYQQLNLPIYGTYLDGDNIYQTSLENKGLIIMGNEGKGIGIDAAAYVSNKLFIPPFPQDIPTSESLNVSIATAVVCAEFRRRTN